MYGVNGKVFSDIDDALIYARARARRLHLGCGIVPLVGICDVDKSVWLAVVSDDANGLTVQLLEGWPEGLVSAYAPESVYAAKEV